MRGRTLEDLDLDLDILDLVVVVTLGREKEGIGIRSRGIEVLLAQGGSEWSRWLRSGLGLRPRAGVVCAVQAWFLGTLLPGGL